LVEFIYFPISDPLKTLVRTLLITGNSRGISNHASWNGDCLPYTSELIPGRKGKQEQEECFKDIGANHQKKLVGVY
jgi:hypothetical protein